jgi:DNA-binding SARP family transcriptional activator
VEFRLLGPIEVRRQGVAITLGGSRQRAVLAALAMRANEGVSVDYLADAAWQRPPASVRANVRTYIANLRRLLIAPGDGGTRLLTTPGGYRLVVRPGELDRAGFEDLARRAGHARAGGDDVTAVDLYDEALKLWRGRPLAGLTLGSALAAAVEQLNERWLQVVEHRIDGQLRLDRHAEVMGELRALAAEYPLRESLPERLMLALYRSGRPAEALAVYQRSRRHLVEELGIEPGPRLRELHQMILQGAPVEPRIAGIGATPGGPVPAGSAIPAELPATASVFRSGPASTTAR